MSDEEIPEVVGNRRRDDAEEQAGPDAPTPSVRSSDLLIAELVAETDNFYESDEVADPRAEQLARLFGIERPLLPIVGAQLARKALALKALATGSAHETAESLDGARWLAGFMETPHRAWQVVMLAASKTDTARLWQFSANLRACLWHEMAHAAEYAEEFVVQFGTQAGGQPSQVARAYRSLNSLRKVSLLALRPESGLTEWHDSYLTAEEISDIAGVKPASVTQARSKARHTLGLRTP